jgi:hypothetical protein
LNLFAYRSMEGRGQSSGVYVKRGASVVTASSAKAFPLNVTGVSEDETQCLKIPIDDLIPTPHCGLLKQLLAYSFGE